MPSPIDPLSEGIEAGADGNDQQPRDEQPRLAQLRIPFGRIVGVTLVAYWAALFWGTHGPAPDLTGLPPYSDKWLHFLGYAGLSFLLGAWFASRKGMRARVMVTVFIVTIIYAALDETLQLFVGRHADIYDGLVDALGSSVGLLLLFSAYYLLCSGRKGTRC
jgi:VanZ family protein